MQEVVFYRESSLPKTSFIISWVLYVALSLENVGSWKEADVTIVALKAASSIWFFF